MSEDQLRQFFRQKIGSLTTGKDVRDAFNALLDFVLAQVGSPAEPDPEPDPAPEPEPGPDPEPEPAPEPTPTPVSKLVYDFSTAASTADFTDNVYNEDYGTFRLRSAGAKSPVIDTDATSVDVRLVRTSPAYEGQLLVYLDGALLTAPTDSGIVQLPGTGTRPLYMREGLHQRENEQGPQQSTSLVGLAFPAGSTNVQRATVRKSKRCLFIGDSIMMGLILVNPSENCLPNQVRRALPDFEAAVDAYGYRALGGSLHTPALRQAQADRAVAYHAGATEKYVYIALGQNDRGGRYADAPTTAGYLSDLIARLHDGDPAIVIFVQSPLRDSIYNAPLLGTTTGLSYCVPVDGRYLIPQPVGGDDVHPALGPTTTYAGKVAQYLAGAYKLPLAAGTRLENNDVRLRLVGAWEELQDAGSFSAGTGNTTTAAGAYAETTQPGLWADVTLRHLRTPSTGNLLVSVDGAPAQLVQVAAGDFAFVEQLLYSGARAAHTSLRITNAEDGKNFIPDRLQFS